MKKTLNYILKNLLFFVNHKENHRLIRDDLDYLKIKVDKIYEHIIDILKGVKNV